MGGNLSKSIVILNQILHTPCEKTSEFNTNGIAPSANPVSIKWKTCDIDPMEFPCKFHANLQWYAIYKPLANPMQMLCKSYANQLLYICGAGSGEEEGGGGRGGKRLHG